MSNAFHAGETATISGLYRTHHGADHVQGHYVIVLFGEVFPTCNECSTRVCFELASSVPHVSAHPMFVRIGR